MIACDKNGEQNIWNGPPGSFGRNHKGTGGHILRLDSSVQWYNVQVWDDPSGNGRDEILGGVSLGSCGLPDNIVGR